MLDCCGLPVTDYLIINLGEISEEESKLAIMDQLHSSRFGIVVRTVTMDDGKRQPYYHIESSISIEPILKKIYKNRFVMSFAARSLPSKAIGFTVGRYLILKDAGELLEYYMDEISPRVFENITFDDVKNGVCGILKKKFGHFWRPSNGFEKDMIHVLRRYRESVDLLMWALGEQGICLEFILHKSKIIFNDFDLTHTRNKL